MDVWTGQPRFLLTPSPGQPGFLSRTFQATRPRDPRKYFLKVGSKDPRARKFARKIRAFRREKIAYQFLAPLAQRVVPRCFASAASPDGSDGLLLLEQINQARSGNQVAGLTFRELSAAVRAIGVVHARLWDGSRKRGQKPLLPLHEYNLAHETKSLAKVFLRKFKSSLSSADRARARLVPRVVSQALRLAKKRPVTLLHGDLRADNLLFSKGRVFLVDWQIAARGLGTFDLARLIGGSSQRPLGLSEQHRLVKIWHRTLRQGGVRRYNLPEAWQDYQIAVALALSIPLTNGPTLAQLSPRGKKIAQRMIRRFFRNGREFGLI